MLFKISDADKQQIVKLSDTAIPKMKYETSSLSHWMCCYNCRSMACTEWDGSVDTAHYLQSTTYFWRYEHYALWYADDSSWEEINLITTTDTTTKNQFIYEEPFAQGDGECDTTTPIWCEWSHEYVYSEESWEGNALTIWADFYVV